MSRAIRSAVVIAIIRIVMASEIGFGIRSVAVAKVGIRVSRMRSIYKLEV